MILKQVQQVLDGTKSQTRRPVKEHEEANRWDSETDVINEVLIVDPNKSYPGNLRSKWLLGRTYAVQPGRGKKAVGRIRITKIRRERLQDITGNDVRAEGCGTWEWPFEELWDSLYRKPYRWQDNPECWVLDFERSEG